jgi:hypothetical protein
MPRKKLPLQCGRQFAEGLVKQQRKLNIPANNKNVKPFVAEERKLKAKVLRYEKLYFEDMTFQPGSIAYDIFAVDGRDILSKRKGRKFFDVSKAGFDFSISNISIKIKKLKKSTDGTFVPGKRIAIDPERGNNRRTILHEMVHFYDWYLSDLRIPLYDILIIRLYAKLKGKIKNLDKLVMQFAHYPNQYRILFRQKAGAHSVFFFLKCLDLELRTGVSLGCISGYFMKNKKFTIEGDIDGRQFCY